MDLVTGARSFALFVIAGLLEIGGGYLVWLWLRDGRGILIGALGGLILFVYGVVPTLQPAHFGRVYAAYGGFFIVSPCCGAGGSMGSVRTAGTSSAPGWR